MRSSYKLPYQHRKLYNIVKILNYASKANNLNKMPLVYKQCYLNVLKAKTSYTIYKKSSIIPSIFINKTIDIHDGLFFSKFLVKDESVLGYKFGQFVLTKRGGAFIHKDNKIAKKKAKLLKQRLATASSKKKKKDKEKKKRKK
jgi:ribosomal protein S19